MNLAEEEEELILAIIFENIDQSNFLFQKPTDLNNKKTNLDDNFINKILKERNDNLEPYYKISFLYESFDKNINKTFNKNNPSNITLPSGSQVPVIESKEIFKSKIKKIVVRFLKVFGKKFVEFLFITLANKIKLPSQVNKSTNEHQATLNTSNQIATGNTLNFTINSSLNSSCNFQTSNKESMFDLNRNFEKELSEFDYEKTILKIVSKEFDLVNYFNDILLGALNFNDENNNQKHYIENSLDYNLNDSQNMNKLLSKRKQIISNLLLFIRLMGVEFLGKYILFARDFINNRKNEFVEIVKKCEFTIFLEYASLNTTNNLIDTKITFMKELENTIVELICKNNCIKKREDSSEKFYEKKFLDKFTLLKNLIYLFEEAINFLSLNFELVYTQQSNGQGNTIDSFANSTLKDIVKEKTEKLNILNLYNFYFMLQMRLMRNFVYNSLNSNVSKIQDFEKKILYNNKKYNLNALIEKYDENNPSKYIFDEFLKLIESHDIDNSLIFSNWIHMFWKNGNVLDAIKIIKKILVSNKKPPFAFLLFNLNFELQKYYPDLFK